MGVDYRDATAPATNFNMVTNLQIMQFGVPLAYKMDNFSVAVTPILQYGALDIMYDASAMGVNVSTQGVAQDLSFGYNVGLAYEVAGLTIGAVYKSEIEMEYKGQISNAIEDFTGNPNGSDKLSTPAEMGVGISYAMGEHTIAVDYKQIKWSDAKGYKDFQWDDQNVVAVGYEYATDAWAVRLGYNYSKSPISDQTNPMAVGGAIGAAGGNYGDTLDIMNLLGFPGIVESHYAIGGTYNFSKTTSVDLAYTYAPEVSQTANITNTLGGTIETKHSQTGVSAQVNFAF
ncbi:OmpP1/FadL family transporter [Sulfurimonas microaerophilic]|uniref:OmpP1/FadL family transporter n=1 Tax=Sulfurimonas microaerophilic TaxID=3058392 RepID=UPI00271453AA|nr:porin [Sulfurimonas sp. hsl 1-7]